MGAPVRCGAIQYRTQWGSDTSFVDVLFIVVPYATYGSSDVVAYGTPRGFLPLRSHARLFATVTTRYYYQARSERLMCLLTWYSVRQQVVVRISGCE